MCPSIRNRNRRGCDPCPLHDPFRPRPPLRTDWHCGVRIGNPPIEHRPKICEPIRRAPAMQAELIGKAVCRSANAPPRSVNAAPRCWARSWGVRNLIFELVRHGSAVNMASAARGYAAGCVGCAPRGRARGYTLIKRRIGGS